MTARSDTGEADARCEAEQDTRPEHEVMRDAWRTLSVVAFASMVIGMSGSALNVALPTVARHFDASSLAASWILLAYMLTNTVLLVAFGRMADMFGRRTMYLTGLAFYTVGSIACGLAPNAWWLVGFRVIQAAGGAMLLTNSAALVTAAFPRRRLGEGMGIYLASFSIAQLCGPTLGGLLAQQAGWQWVFWFNVPIGILCLLWGFIALKPSPRTGRSYSLDLRGNAMILVALTCGLAALSQATSLGWSHPLVIGGLIVSAAIVPLFLWFEKSVDDPLIDIQLFKHWPFGFGLLASFLNSISQSGVVLLMALYFQAVSGVTPLVAGVMVLPVAVAALTASLSSGPLQRIVSPSTLAVTGNVVTVVALVVLFVGTTGRMPLWVLLVGLAIAGFGSGLFMPSNATAIMGDLPDERLGIANAMRLLLQTSGFVVGTAVILSVVTSALPLDLRKFVFAGTISEISDSAVEQLLTGYGRTIIAMIVVAILTVGVSLFARHSRTAGRR
ncbi:MFS transporter [Rhodococcus sp. 06-621-2]|nr:DHA2 family efflux MFS transporter permease subunit [Rhodococcus sp. 06-621-2]OZC46769.1 MFS transporter [Rhodococcus sp. 06-621-2]